MKPEANTTNSAEKSREQIKIEREAKKAAKQSVKTKSKDKIENPPVSKPAEATKTEIKANTKYEPKAAAKLEPKVITIKATTKVEPKAVAETKTFSSESSSADKLREQIKAEREAKKLAKQASKSKGKPDPQVTESVEQVTHAVAKVTLGESDDTKKPVLSKAERRAIQEAQRATKALKTAPTVANPKVETKSVSLKAKSKSPIKHDEKNTSKDCKIKLFRHLEYTKGIPDILLNGTLHPAIIQLGEQYSKRTIVGSNARYFAFLNAIKKVSFFIWFFKVIS